MIPKITMPLLVPASHAVHELEVRRSRFISQAEKIEDPKAAKDHQHKRREEYPGCSHVVYAFLIGTENNYTMGQTDDGEPKGTSGSPVLEAIKGSGVTNVLITVVRYFGGTKLGKGGLVRAYTDSAKGALNNLVTEPFVRKCRFSLQIPYNIFDPFNKLVAEQGGEVLSAEYNTDISVKFTVPEDEVAHVRDVLRDMTSGSVILPENNEGNNNG
ncbi:MAG: IMPACT family protein [Spirochaetia bacterium]